jgi:hypothetical protein
MSVSITPALLISAAGVEARCRLALQPGLHAGCSFHRLRQVDGPLLQACPQTGRLGSQRVARLARRAQQLVVGREQLRPGRAMRPSGRRVVSSWRSNPFEMQLAMMPRIVHENVPQVFSPLAERKSGAL